MKFNQEQQAAIESMNSNLVVTAGAGAGKTTVLSERFINLLQNSGCEIDQILTMTFTEKAAAEMRERIRSRIIASEDIIVQAHLPHLDSASVSTLDSFCLSIARSRFSYYGLPANSSPDEERSALITREAALSWLLKEQDHPALKQIIELEGFEKIWLELLVPVAQTFFSLVNPIDFEEVANEQLSYLKTQFLEKRQGLSPLLNKMKELEVNTAGAQKWVQLALSWDDLPGEESLGDDDYRFFATLFREKLPRMIGSNVKKENDQLMREWAMILRDDFYTPMSSILPYLTMQSTYRSFYRQLDGWHTFLLEKRRASGVVTFGEIAQMAVDVLKREKVLRRYYKDKFRFLMVDEFQDNNQLQRDLLFLLAEKEGEECDGIPGAGDLAPDKLFFVGDEKQSVYRFRGADVSVFKQLGRDLKKVNGEELILSTNYRSEPGLIRFFNEFFEGIFPDQTKSAFYEAGFQALKSRDACLNEPSRIELLLPENDPVSNYDSVTLAFCEADAVASMIQTYIQKGVTVSQGKDQPPIACDYKDFAILFRTTTAQHRFERVFRERQIPYHSQTVTSFFAESLFGDINALLNLVIYPDDLYSYGVVLRSPLCQIQDETLIKIMLEKKSLFDFNEMDLPAENLALLSQIASLYQQLVENADSIPMAELLDLIWYGYGYRCSYMENRLGETVFTHFNYFRSIAEDFDRSGKTLAELTAWCRLRQGEYKKLDNPPKEGGLPNAVQLMTIHKSKGLQFPIVIMADCGSGSVNRESAQLYYDSREFGPAVHLIFSDENGVRTKADYLYAMAKEENSLMEEAELNRLLYVAMTRAKDHLIFSGFTRRKKSGVTLLDKIKGYITEKIGADSDEWVGDEVLLKQNHFIPCPLNKLLKGLSAADINTAHSSLPDYEALRSDNSMDCLYLQRNETVTALAAKELEDIAQDEKIKAPGAFLPSLEIDSILSELKLENSFGTLSHDLLELHFKGIDIDSLILERYPAVLNEFSVSDRPAVANSALKMANGFLRSDLYRELMNDKPIRVIPEAEFMLKEVDDSGNRYIRGRVDLMIEYSNRIEVIDYKSDRKKNPESYKIQLDYYQKAFQAISGKKVSCQIVYLRSCF